MMVFTTIEGLNKAQEQGLGGLDQPVDHTPALKNRV